MAVTKLNGVAHALLFRLHSLISGLNTASPNICRPRPQTLSDPPQVTGVTRVVVTSGDSNNAVRRPETLEC